MNENLISTLATIHHCLAYRNSASTTAIITAAKHGQSLFQAISQAAATLGCAHAPILQAYDLFTTDKPITEITRLVDMGVKVPGFGNSFVKGTDPAWEPLIPLLSEESMKLLETMQNHVFVATNKQLPPNAAAYTALVGIEAKLQRHMVPALVLESRMAAWLEIYQHNYERSV